MFGTRLPRINAVQFATIVTAGYVGMGIFYFPGPLVQAAGRAAVWGLWLDGLLAFMLMRLVFRMDRLVPNDTLSAFASKLLSKPLGVVVGLATTVYHLMLVCVAVVVFSGVLHNVFLPKTPMWALNALLTLTATYVCWAGATALARTLQASYVPVALLTLLSLVIALSSVQHPSLFLPGQDIPLLGLASGAYHQFFIFIGFEVSVTLYPYVSDKDRKKAEQYSYWALAGVMMILTLQYEIVMAVFGPQVIDTLRWPLVSTYRIISLNGFYISKVGTLAIVFWSIVIVAFAAVRLWCLSHDFQALSLMLVSLRYRTSLLIMTALAIIGEALLSGALTSDVWIYRYMVPVGLAYLVLIPLAVLTAARLRPKTLLELQVLSEKGKGV